MRNPEFYLGEGEFTRKGDKTRDIASQINGGYIIEGINEFVNSLPCRQEEKPRLFRKRTSEQIIKDGFITGCTDMALVFCTLSRIKGFPAVYVEAFEEKFLENPKKTIEAHIFSDIYQDGIWIPYNPGCGKTAKIANMYFYLPTTTSAMYMAKGRGLDFSELYPDDSSVEHFQLRDMKDMLDFLKLE
jgi:hypothetical protein